MEQLILRLRPRTVARWSAALILALLALSVAGQMMKYFGGHDRVFGLIRLFYLDEETNVPSLYSALQLLVVAGVLWLIAKFKRKSGGSFVRHWQALALIFGYLALDEAVSLHERLSDPVQAALHLTGALTFSWVVVFAPIVVLFALSYLRFLWYLPPRTRRLVALAGTAFVGAALGFEPLEAAWLAERQWVVGFGLTVLVTLEEGTEMASIALFLYALLDYAARCMPELRVLVGDGPVPEMTRPAAEAAGRLDDQWEQGA
jgi:hypothetical protein